MSLRILTTGERRTHVEKVAQFFVRTIPHCMDIGLQFDELDEGYCLAHIPFNPHLISNPVTGAMHSGAILSLIDTVAGAAALTALPQLGPAGTLDLRVDYLEDAEEGQVIQALGTKIKVNKEIVFAKAIAFHDDPNRPIAIGVGTFMVQQIVLKKPEQVRT